MSEEYMEVNINLIDDPDSAMRLDMDQTNLDELTESIKAHGIIQPLVLRRRGDRFEVIAGHRRLVAAGRARLSKVPAVVRLSSDSETTILRMHENLIRDEVDAVSEAIFISKAIKELNLGVDVFAGMLRKSEAYVQDRLTIAEMPEYMQMAIKNKVVPLGVALELFKLDNAQLMESWFNAAARDGMSVRAARDAVRDYFFRSGAAAADLSGASAYVPPVAPPMILYPCARCGVTSPIEVLQLVRVHRGDTCDRYASPN